MASEPMTSGRKLTLLDRLLKSIDGAPLEEITDVMSNTEVGVDRTLPTAGESGASNMVFEARGGKAGSQSQMYNQNHPQDGREAIFEQLANIVGGAMKSEMKGVLASLAKSNQKFVADLVAGLAKAEEDDEKDKKEKAEKAAVAAKATAEAAAGAASAAPAIDPIASAMRKARLAIAKASDEDDDDDDSVEKANAAISEVKAAVAKAEDDADNDDDEKKAEKARGDLKSLKAKFAKAQTDASDRKAAKAAKVADPAAAEKLIEASVKASFEKFAKAERMDMPAVMAFLAKQGATPSGLAAPPTVAKAGLMVVRNVDAIAARLGDAEFEMAPLALAKAQSIFARYQHAEKGLIDKTSVEDEINKADPLIQAIFAPSVAA